MSTNARLLYIIRVTIIMLLLTGLGSCVRDDKLEFPEEMTETVLRLSTRASVTRADNHYQDDPFAEQNEEAIKRVDLFFFDSDVSTTPAFYVCELSVEETTTADLSVGIPVSLIAEKSSVYVYALVNLPESVKVNTVAKQISAEDENAVAATLENIKKTWVSEEAFATSGAVPKTFIMRGGNTVTLNQQGGSEAAAAGVILVERLASKVRLWADIDEIIYIDETTGKTINQEDYGSEDEWQAAISKEGVEAWKSIATSNGESEVKLYLYNLTTRGRIEGSASAAGISYFGEDYPDIETDRASLWNYRNVDRSAAAAEAVRPLSADTGLTSPGPGDGSYPYTHKVAYYSYPNIWDSTTPAEEHQTNVIVSVLWEKMDDNSAEYKTCYYQVPVNVLRSASQDAAQADRLEPNRYYRIKVHIGMLGSTVLDKPTDVKASYEVVDWGIADVNVDIKDRRFLVVNQKNWVMNNTHTLEIPFFTSHKTKVEECFVNYFRYNDIWGTDDDANEKAANLNEIQKQHPELYHNKEEFMSWISAADDQLKEKRAGEGAIVADFDNISGDSLYYKSKYFNDPYIGYTYYVGHEHPKTIKRRMIQYEATSSYMDKKALDAWTLYNEKYDNINAVYTCEVDDEKNVIRFTHPLVLWEEGGTGNSMYYYPDTVEDGSSGEKRLRDEFSRVEIIIKIRHEDWTKDDLFTETIYITQYPGMYVEVSHNYSTAAEDGGANSIEEGVSESIIVNGTRVPFARSGDNDLYPNKPYLISYTPLPNFLGSNNNPNMYVIHTTQLSEEIAQSYEIGDPRTLYSDNYLNPYERINNAGAPFSEKLTVLNEVNNTEWAGYAYRWYGAAWYEKEDYHNEPYKISLAEATNIVSNTPSVTMRYYYPTDESEGAGSKENYIAPVFRIASSFGKVAVGYRLEARRRCSVYQEAGRPAGRWRLPTKAEIKYVARLSADGKIPILLGDNNDPELFGEYWSAQGGLLVNGVGVVKDSAAGQGGVVGVFAPRCVYDEWYWNQIDGKELPTPNGATETTFYWGDVKKDNTQAQPKN